MFLREACLLERSGHITDRASAFLQCDLEIKKRHVKESYSNLAFLRLDV